MQTYTTFRGSSTEREIINFNVPSDWSELGDSSVKPLCTAENHQSQRNACAMSRLGYLFQQFSVGIATPQHLHLMNGYLIEFD